MSNRVSLLKQTHQNFLMTIRGVDVVEPGVHRAVHSNCRCEQQLRFQVSLTRLTLSLDFRTTTRLIPHWFQASKLAQKIL